MKPISRVNNDDDKFSEAATIDTSATVEDQVNQIDAMMQKHSIYDANYDSDYDDFKDNCVAIISDSDSFREMEPVNMHIQFRSNETKALVASGRVCTITNKNLANAAVLNSKEIYSVQTLEFRDLKTFSNKLIKIIGVINTTLKCIDWVTTYVNVTVDEVCHRPTIGRDLFPQNGLSLTQSKKV